MVQTLGNPHKCTDHPTPGNSGPFCRCGPSHANHAISLHPGTRSQNISDTACRSCTTQQTRWCHSFYTSFHTTKLPQEKVCYSKHTKCKAHIPEEIQMITDKVSHFISPKIRPPRRTKHEGRCPGDNAVNSTPIPLTTLSKRQGTVPRVSG